MRLETLRRKLGRSLEWPIAPRRQGEAVARGIRALAGERLPRGLEEAPYDGTLLAVSKLYRRSRALYLGAGGTFRAALVTSPRTLSSPILLEPRIEYSPIESELVWAATDPAQRRDPGHLLRLRTCATSLFHEQNHRVLWKHLPPPPRGGAVVRRYLNYAESLVVACDMALGDELGPRVAPFFYLAGVTYDPGTAILGEGLSRREYRNYLHAASLGTYLVLEGYRTSDVLRALEHHFPALGGLAGRAADRSGRLDPEFVATTNRAWQARYARRIPRALARAGVAPLELADDPADIRLQYLLAESWFERLGL
jgi:hypothetical protein